jgi:hypothetical protein
MRRPRRPARELRAAIDEMPLTTRQAMIDGIARNPIIVGAYAAPDGGICPMLAAHRNGGRTDYAAFACAWDRYARAGRRPRRATQRELKALTAMLDASVAEDGVRGAGALRRAIADHRSTQYARALREELAVEPYELDLEEPDYSPSPGRTNCSSGTMQAGEVLSR